MWGPQTGGRHTARTGTTHMATTDQPEIDHPAILWSFGPLCPPNHHPSPTPLEGPPQTRRVRVLHEGTASVTSRIRNLGMKTRRTSYRTALGSLKHFVSDIWPDGPEVQRG